MRTTALLLPFLAAAATGCGRTGLPQPANVSNTGLVLLQDTADEEGHATGSVTIWFQRLTQISARAPTCQSQTGTTVGSCTYYVNNQACDAQYAADYQSQYVSAGTIFIDGASAPLELTQNDAGMYEAQTEVPLNPPDGGMITISSTGGTGAGDMPAFDVELPVISAPPPLMVPDGGTTVSTSSDLKLTWSQSLAGSDELSVVQGGSSFVNDFTLCSLMPGADTFEVPAAVLGAMPAGSASLQVESYASVDETVGDYGVQVRNESYAPAVGVTLQ